MVSSNHLGGFLLGTKKWFQEALRKDENVTIVIGNQSADLDSFSSSILYAYFRSQIFPSPKSCIPILCIPSADISLRPEFLSLFRETSISRTDLTTLDDIPPGLSPDRTSWILVDHNKLEGPLASYGNRVIGCIDHHEEEHAVPIETGFEPRIIEKCGSCASLVVKHHLDNQSGADLPKVPAVVAKLGLASILIDTRNLRDEHKVRPVDVDATEFLVDVIQKEEGAEWDRDAFYKVIDRAKNDLESLSLQSIFKKDYKAWNEGGLKLGTSASVKPLNFLVGKCQAEAEQEERLEDAWEQTTEDFMKKQELDIWSVMTAFQDQQGEFKRELLVQSVGRAKKVIQKFEEKEGKALQLKALRIDGLGHNDGDAKWRKVWSQGDLSSSRKQVAPKIREAMRVA